MPQTFDYKFDDLFNPTLQAIHALGGSASVDEIEEQVIKILNLTDEQINDLHIAKNLKTTKLLYRLAWARTYLKFFGILENTARGIWTLTEVGLKTQQVEKEEVKNKYKTRNQHSTVDVLANNEEENNEEIQALTWQEQVIETLQNIPPASFERLCQRVLRELGFDSVEVTGKTGDGGIDGKGLLKIGEILSFHVVFQAKRYRSSVSPSIIRDFRGAMVGRADKGLIITTGNFTHEAKKEAQRDGATPIDLINGNELAQILKKTGLRYSG